MKLRENSPVEFDLDGQVVTGTVVRLEGRKIVVRYGLERILDLMWYNVMMVEREVDEDLEEDGGDILSISGRPGDNFDLAWKGWEDDKLPSYFGTKMNCCFYCWVPVDKDEILNKRRLRNWDVPICTTYLAHPGQRPCQGCHAGRNVCICGELEDGRKC